MEGEPTAFNKIDRVTPFNPVTFLELNIFIAVLITSTLYNLFLGS